MYLNQSLIEIDIQYSHPGVAAHPGDFGMEDIAKSLFAVARHLIE